MPSNDLGYVNYLHQPALTEVIYIGVWGDVAVLELTHSLPDSLLFRA